jgi:hypothetical protein
VLRASAEEHPDLYWALRGGSGNFGIVTSFELKLHPVTQVLGGMLIHPVRVFAGEVLRFYREVAASAPGRADHLRGLVTTPDGQQAVAIMPCYCGSIEEGERILAPIRAFGPPIADLIRPMKYSEMNTLIDEANPPGMQNYWKWNGLRELSDAAIDAIVRARRPRAVPALRYPDRPAARRRQPVAPSETAFAHRDAPHAWSSSRCGRILRTPRPTSPGRGGLAAATERYATGASYVNGADLGTRASAAYGGQL